MRRLCSVVLIMLCFTVRGQKPSQFGFSGNVVNFSGTVLDKGNINPGFSLFFWKGITKKLDYSIRYNGLFTDYNKSPGYSSSYVNEFEGSLHLHVVNDEHLFSPFLSAGYGIGLYGSTWTSYTPLGGGLQLNLGDEAYIYFQVNYRVSLQAPHLDNNIFYSLGISQTIGKKKVTEPAPLPMIPIVTDRDNDGIPDSVDACPDLAGTAQFKGCPDTDGDGIPDNEDKCPTQAGVAKYQGCPIPDSDGDGINDEEDKCPHEAGIAKYQGCPIPDRDHDGVNDEEDQCPDIPGTVANKGLSRGERRCHKKSRLCGTAIVFRNRPVQNC